MAGAFTKIENAKRINERKPVLPQPKRRVRAKKDKTEILESALSKEYSNVATALAAGGELEDGRPPAKRQKLDAAQIVDELLAGIRPNSTSDGESMEEQQSDDSGFESGGEQAIPVLTANVPSQVPPPQRPNTPSKAPQRPTTLALNTSPPSGNQGKCIWCLTVRALLPGKRFCAECSAQGCECAYCHRPMPERFFTFSERLCNACFKKDAKQKAKRRSQSAQNGKRM